MLDYYTITNLKPNIVLEYITDNRNFSSKSSDFIKKKMKVRNFLEENKRLGILVSEENIGVLMSRIINSNGSFEIQDYFDEILKTLNEHHIEPYRQLVDDAFIRIARGVPIFPLETIQKEESENLISLLEEEKKEKPKKKVKMKKNR